MGLSFSKAADDSVADMAENKLSSLILTPQIRRLNIDPRSPTLEIVRTPIEVFTPKEMMAANENIEKSLNLTNNFDPRSPTMEFQRTPIDVNSETRAKPIYNRLLSNARQPIIVLTPIRPREKTTSDSKLLEESKKNVNVNKRHSFSGLLETNIDYVETDLDVVIQKKVLQNELIEELENCEDVYNSDVEDEDASMTDNSKFELSATEERLFQMKIDEITNGDILNTGGSCLFELDKKLTDLICDDTDVEVKSPITIPKPNHRTPLGDRNINNQPKKVIPVLKVNNKPTKLPKHLSKIPVFKEKRLKGSSAQCENTPPRLTNRSHWSTEDSLII
ncbi:hypothetical protein FQA39_LY14617 [Lamprigera yunnana]|nr:hypothetical protein FQA39_LY14617 [Lamprigera yunnana]